MLNNNIKAHVAKFCLIVGAGIMLNACAHQSTIKPSNGHIDGKVTAQQAASQANAAEAPRTGVRRERSYYHATRSLCLRR